jgi:hypothetical protein
MSWEEGQDGLEEAKDRELAEGNGYFEEIFTI